MLPRPNDIVTDLDEESCYFGKQGQVVAIQYHFWEEPEILVRFDRELYWSYLGDDECVDGVYDVYPSHHLKRNEDWEPEVYALKFFRGKHHTICSLKDALDPDQICMVEDCASGQIRTIWFNVWGSVCNTHVCEEHAKRYHRYYMDVFPWRTSRAA